MQHYNSSNNPPQDASDILTLDKIRARWKSKMDAPDFSWDQASDEMIADCVSGAQEFFARTYGSDVVSGASRYLLSTWAGLEKDLSTAEPATFAIALENSLFTLKLNAEPSAADDSAAHQVASAERNSLDVDATLEKSSFGERILARDEQDTDASRQEEFAPKLTLTHLRILAIGFEYMANPSTALSPIDVALCFGAVQVIQENLSHHNKNEFNLTQRFTGLTIDEAECFPGYDLVLTQTMRTPSLKETADETPPSARVRGRPR